MRFNSDGLFQGDDGAPGLPGEPGGYGRPGSKGELIDVHLILDVHDTISLPALWIGLHTNQSFHFSVI